MTRLLPRTVAAALTLAAAAVAFAGAASAHERRTVGAVQFVVGWGDEPAYNGFKNSVQLTISEANGGAPVTDITDTLKVEVVKGSDKMTVPLTPNFRVGAFGTPGDYRAWITPTRAGAYSFHVTGTIRGQNIDETFSSSKTTFNDIEVVATIEFPAKDPSTDQLATRIDREVPRLDSATSQAKDDAGTARTLALLGLAVGVVGVLVGAAALVAARRTAGGAGGAGVKPGRKAAADKPEPLSR